MSKAPSSFAQTLYFDAHRVDELKPLEIWNGLRELEDPMEKTLLIKNLYKIAIPLVNEECSGRSFVEQAARVRQSVEAIYDALTSGTEPKVLTHFPHPPVSEPQQKALYRVVRDKTREILKESLRSCSQMESQALFPDGLFDFRELRIVDNELPYIIFTEKEFKVIHGLVLVYLWLIDLDALFVSTLTRTGVAEDIVREYGLIGDRVRAANPFTVSPKGTPSGTQDIIARMQQRIAAEDYLDFFEEVFLWFESMKESVGPRG